MEFQSAIKDDPIKIKDAADGFDSSFERALIGQDAAFTLLRQSALRRTLGLDLPHLEALFERSEFVSLGGFCGVSQALGSLGLRTSAGPFDWVRCSIDGILQCLERAFADFLTFKTTKNIAGHKVFQGSQWGASFWHHDIEDRSIMEQLTRRAERHFGTEQRQSTAPRFFIRVANSTEELSLASTLLATLQFAFHNSPVYLLIIVDMQKSDSLIHVQSTSSHLLFHLVHEDLWLNASPDTGVQLQTSAEKYAACIGAAVHHWAKGVIVPSREPAGNINFHGWIECYNAGDPAYKAYSPNGMTGFIQVPEGKQAGDVIHTNCLACDKDDIVAVRLPEGANAGCLLELHHTNDGVSVQLVPDNRVVAARALLAAAGAITTAAAATAAAPGTAAIAASTAVASTIL